MRRRTILSTTVGAGFLAGCLSAAGSCQGVELAIRLHPSRSTTDDDVLDLEDLDLTDRQRSLLRSATAEQLRTCTRDDGDRATALHGLIETVARAAGHNHGDLYYSDQRIRFPARFDGERYSAELVFDTAESAGGPL